MDKTLIFVVGPTTVGKSTLVSSLLDANKDIFSIPLYARRDPRADDDLRLTLPVSEEEYKAEKMFLDDYPYGIPHRFIKQFKSSNAAFGISISTPEGLNFITEQLYQEEYKDIRRCSIVMTLSHTVNEEADILAQRIDNFFPDLKANIWRKKHHLSFVEEYFHNAEYITKNCDLKLVQDGKTVLDWCDQIADYLKTPLTPDRNFLKSTIEKNMHMR